MCKAETHSSSWGKQLFDLSIRDNVTTFLEKMGTSLGASFVLRAEASVLVDTRMQPTAAIAADWTGIRQPGFSRKFNVVGLGTVTLEADISNESGRTKTLVGAIGDILEILLKNAIESYLLTRSVLHETQLSLSAVSGAGEYVADKLLPENWDDHNEQLRGLVRHNLTIIHDHVRHAANLNANLVEYYSLDRDLRSTKPNFKSIDLAAEIEKSAALWERLAKRKDVDIRCELRDRARINGDPFLIRRLLDNLLSNAVKYSYSTSHRGGRRFIQIASHRHDPGFRESRIAVTISNYGLAIKKEELPLLAEPGFRGEQAVREQPEGLGIGLYLAKQIALVHRGDLKIDSKYLHSTTRVVAGQEVVEETHKIDCTLILPVA